MGGVVKAKKVSASQSTNLNDFAELVLRGLTKAQDAIDTKKALQKLNPGLPPGVAAFFWRDQVPFRSLQLGTDCSAPAQCELRKLCWLNQVELNSPTRSR